MPSIEDFIRWTIFVDIEGFGERYLSMPPKETEADFLLRELMRDIYRIGSEIYCRENDRLFVHQAGDGFFILPDFGDISLERPIGIAISLMRASLLRNGGLKSAISFGDRADITGVYPREVREAANGENILKLGDGLMTIISVMGEGIVRAHKISQCASGPLLLIDRILAPKVRDLNLEFTEYARHIELNHIRIHLTLADRILAHLGYSPPSADELRRKLLDYIAANESISDPWRRGANSLI